MSDDLVRRARFVVQLFQECDAIQLPHKPTEEVLTGMADRIEALTADRDKGAKDYCGLMDRYDAVCVERDALAEKLADIVDAWEWWQVDPYDRCQSVPQDAVDAARATLAQITGGKTDDHTD